MKKTSLFLSLLFVVSLLKAQSNKEEIDYMQSIFGMQKKEVVAEFVKVEDAQKDAFWKLYDEYETARKELGKQRIDMLVKYSENYNKMTNESAEAWTDEVIELGKKTDDLLIEYYKKVKKIANPIVASQFYQVEVYILTVVRLNILGQLPFVEAK
jgi:hypothetical protein